MDDDLADELIAGIVGERIDRRARGRFALVWRWWQRLVMVVACGLFALVFVLLILDTIR